MSLLQTFGEVTGTRIIAEGVETEDEMEALLRCNIKLMQGYFWARPSEVEP